MGLVIAVATIASYGSAWWIVGLWAAGRGSRLGYAVAGALLVLLLAGAWWRKSDETPERRRERARRGHIIGVVTGAQAVLIMIVLYLLRLAGGIDLLAPLIAIIVGLHFLAFARLFPARLYYVTSALLVLLGLAGFAFRPGPPRLLIVSISAAAILWLTCVAVLIWPEGRRASP